MADGFDIVSYLMGKQAGGGGGGGGGIVYEAGTWTPTADIAKPEIKFANSYAEAPAIVVMADVSPTAFTQGSSNAGFVFVRYDALFGDGIQYVSDGKVYGLAGFAYCTNPGSALSSGSYTTITHPSGEEGSSASYTDNWVRPTGFTPNSNSQNRYWSAGRTYKWIAIWAPTT